MRRGAGQRARARVRDGQQVRGNAVGRGRLPPGRRQQLRHDAVEAREHLARGAHVLRAWALRMTLLALGHTLQQQHTRPCHDRVGLALDLRPASPSSNISAHESCNRFQAHRLRPVARGANTRLSRDHTRREGLLCCCAAAGWRPSTFGSF